LCEAKSGYVWNFIIYTGQDTVFDEFLKNEPNGSKLILQLIAPLLNQGYCVIIDNLFLSPDLIHKLYSKQTDAMGTLHQNMMGVLSDMKSAKLKKDDHVSVCKDRLMIVKWKTEKDICLTSTTHDDKMVPTRVRGQDMKKPKVIIDYNCGMGGMDLSDAYLTTYHSTMGGGGTSKALLSFD
jgi:hypothetical protein